jgi:hypothetical protein
MYAEGLFTGVSIPYVDQGVGSTCITQALVITCQTCEISCRILPKDTPFLRLTFKIPRTHMLFASCPEVVMAVLFSETHIEDLIYSSFLLKKFLSIAGIKAKNVMIVMLISHSDVSTVW